MIKSNNVIVLDIDGTLTEARKENQDYLEVSPNIDMIRKVQCYKNDGFYIVLYTSRQMRTFEGNIGKINANTAKVLFEWLERNEVPYDEIHFGKPWCGNNGFYVDDKAIRPSEFLEMSFDEINNMLNGGK